MIVGSVYNTVKLASLDMKWQQRKQNNLQKDKAEMTAEESQLERLKEDAKNIRESNDNARIYSKIRAGEDLTQEEISYLRQNNPQMLTKYEEIKQEEAAYKRRLKNCRTKDEVDELNTQKMGEFLSQVKAISNDPYIPESKKLELVGAIEAKMKNVQKAYAEFVQSGTYASLPTEEEKLEETKARRELQEAEISRPETQEVQETEIARPEAQEAKETQIAPPEVQEVQEKETPSVPQHQKEDPEKRRGVQASQKPKRSQE